MQHPMKKENTHKAVTFLASDINRFSINALTGVIEQDSDLHVQLAFLHPRSVAADRAEIEVLLREVGSAGTSIQFMPPGSVARTMRSTFE